MKWILMCLILFSPTIWANNSEQQKLADWLEIEYGSKPQKIETIYSTNTYWPFSKEEKEIFFHKFQMNNGYSNIGITGPISFSLFKVNHEQFTNEDLIKIYIGWYSVFTIQSNRMHDEEVEKLTCKALSDNLKIDKWVVQSCENVSYGSFKHSALKVISVDGNETAILFAYDEQILGAADSNIDFSNLPPIYYYIGVELFRDEL